MFAQRLHCAFGTVTLRAGRIDAAFTVRLCDNNFTLRLRYGIILPYDIEKMIIFMVRCPRVDTVASKARRSGVGSYGDEKCATATGPSLSPLRLS